MLRPRWQDFHPAGHLANERLQHENLAQAALPEANLNYNTDIRDQMHPRKHSHITKSSLSSRNRSKRQCPALKPRAHPPNSWLCVSFGDGAFSYRGCPIILRQWRAICCSSSAGTILILSAVRPRNSRPFVTAERT